MTGRHHRGEQFALLAPRPRLAVAPRPEERVGAHRAHAPGLGRAVARSAWFAVLPAMTVGGLLSSSTEPATAVVIDGAEGGTNTSITVAEFVDGKTARLVGCGKGQQGMGHQQALVLTGVAEDGAARLQLGTESVFNTPSGDWSCATGTILAENELTAIGGQQPDGGSWQVDNPLVGATFGERSLTHAGGGSPPRLATSAQARQALRDALAPQGPAGPPRR